MAKGGGNNQAAIKLQQQSMKDSRLQAARMEKLMRESAKAAESPEMTLPVFQGPSPVPTTSTADLDAVAMETRQRAMRRQGLNATVYAGAKAANNYQKAA